MHEQDDIMTHDETMHLDNLVLCMPGACVQWFWFSGGDVLGQMPTITKNRTKVTTCSKRCVAIQQGNKVHVHGFSGIFMDFVHQIFSYHFYDWDFEIWMIWGWSLTMWSSTWPAIPTPRSIRFTRSTQDTDTTDTTDTMCRCPHPRSRQFDQLQHLQLDFQRARVMVVTVRRCSVPPRSFPSLGVADDLMQRLQSRQRCRRTRRTRRVQSTRSNWRMRPAR